MKLAIVEATFPELKSGSMYKTGRGKASSAKPAIARAFADVLKQVKGKRWVTVKTTITVTECE